ncbi:epoxide hydrolase family protein [Actinacidiphila acididurans]|uniref:epoxide hydrolase family protein n=1 Tax=Actinacidiphila acididurans TaxID=2784346 RepID=UPI0027DC26CB|nr:epoxide hydrolase [Actinacidiphila acididurans]
MSATRLDELLEHWATGYDWAVHERRIGAFPWTTVRAGTADLRVIHQRSADPGAPVVVLLHGWPDSVLRFERVLPLLADTHVVVPALPGFPFAAPLTTPGMSANRIAGIVADALDELGYSRYTVSGGDVGGTVAEILAAEHPDRVAALHLTNIAPQHALTADPAELTPDAAAYLGRTAAGGHFAAWEQPEAYAGDVHRAVKLDGRTSRTGRTWSPRPPRAFSPLCRRATAMMLAYNGETMCVDCVHSM